MKTSKVDFVDAGAKSAGQYYFDWNEKRMMREMMKNKWKIWRDAIGAEG